MSFVVTFTDYTPSARYDALPWTHVRIEEATVKAGPWAVLETQLLAPVDADPTNPASRDFTTELATIPAGWYRLTFLDASGDQQPTAPVRNGAGAADLTTLAAVREHLQLTGGVEIEQDPVIANLITRMSRHIMRAKQREFAPPEAAAVRVVELDEDCRLQSLAPYDCRAATSVVLDDGLPTERTLDALEWKLALRDPENAVWKAIRLRRALCGQTLTITGDWGFAAIPDDVEQACVLAVTMALKGDVQAFGGPLQPNSFGDGVNADQALPPGVRGLLAPFDRGFYR